MDEYLKNMKCLRSQMNDFEEETANTSLEEEKLRTAIRSVEKDIGSATLETKKFKDEISEILKSKGEICCQILEKQKQILSLESESSTFTQTLEFLGREKVILTENFIEKSAYHKKIQSDLNAKLLEQQEWFTSWKGKECPIQNMDLDEGNNKIIQLNSSASAVRVGELESLTAKLEDLRTKKYELDLEINKSNQRLQLLTKNIDGFPNELKEMDFKALEEEHRALLTDKTGEAEYLQSLQHRVQQLQGISDDVKCQCGTEYKVELGNDFSMISAVMSNGSSK